MSFYTTGMKHSPTRATGNGVGTHAVARDAAGGVGGVETPGSLTSNRESGYVARPPEDEAVLVQVNRSPIIGSN